MPSRPSFRRFEQLLGIVDQGFLNEVIGVIPVATERDGEGSHIWNSGYEFVSDGAMSCLTLH